MLHLRHTQCMKTFLFLLKLSALQYCHLDSWTKSSRIHTESNEMDTITIIIILLFWKTTVCLVCNELDFKKIEKHFLSDKDTSKFLCHRVGVEEIFSCYHRTSPWMFAFSTKNKYNLLPHKTSTQCLNLNLHKQPFNSPWIPILYNFLQKMYHSKHWSSNTLSHFILQKPG